MFIQYGYSGATLPVDQYVQLAVWRHIHPEVRRRLMALIVATNYRLGVGGTWRSALQQINMFHDRHHIVTGPTSIVYDGHYWARNVGAAPCAIPGQSYHEPCVNEAGFPDSSDATGLCVAIDTLNLVTAGVTKAQLATYGLLNFVGEEWHVQPIEWPTARKSWNAAPAPLKVWALPNDEPLPPPAPAPPAAPIEDEDDMTTARLWKHPKYQNVWLVGPSTLHLSGKLAASYVASGIALIEEAHDQTLKTVLFQCGLTTADLVPV